MPTPFPRAPGFDSTLAFLSEGYEFVSNRCKRLNTDVFETRLMLRPAICARGEDAARMFYHPDRFTRQGAIPPTTMRLLQDIGSVQSLSGEAHRHRKAMFMELMSPESITRLVEIMRAEWLDRLAQWERVNAIVLHPAAERILCVATCRWAGIPLSEQEADKRTREVDAMLKGAGSIGPQMVRGLILRRRSERWARDVIEAFRAGKIDAPEGSALRVIAEHREPDGKRLDVKIAGVELINLLRPTVAVARFITYGALALHIDPQLRERLRAGEDGYAELITQEVRRFYPVFPVVGGRVQQPFEWRGHAFDVGAWVLLDLYGTNRDPRTWDDPDTFQPERFRTWEENAYNFIPQGGGDFYFDHRCPGEWIAIALTNAALDLLANAMTYEVPPQDLSIDLSQMPALPKSEFVISNVRRSSSG